MSGGIALRHHPEPQVFRAVHQLGSTCAYTGEQGNGVPLDQRHVLEIQHHLHVTLAVDTGPEIGCARGVDSAAHRKGDGAAVDAAFNAVGQGRFATEPFEATVVPAANTPLSAKCGLAL